MLLSPIYNMIYYTVIHNTYTLYIVHVSIFIAYIFMINRKGIDVNGYKKERAQIEFSLFFQICQSIYLYKNISIYFVNYIFIQILFPYSFRSVNLSTYTKIYPSIYPSILSTICPQIYCLPYYFRSVNLSIIQKQMDISMIYPSIFLTICSYRYAFPYYFRSVNLSIQKYIHLSIYIFITKYILIPIYIFIQKYIHSCILFIQLYIFISLQLSIYLTI